MKTYACSNCKTEVRRPTAPLKCAACGQQRIGLFKEVTAAAASTTAPSTATPSASPAPPASPPASPSKGPSPAPPRVAPPPASAPAPPKQPLHYPAPPPMPAKTAAAAAPKPASPAPASRASGTPSSTVPPVSTPRPSAPSAAPVAAPAAPAPSGPGSIAWRFPVHIPGQDFCTTALRNCVAIEGERMYAAIGSTLYALADGESAPTALWKYATGGHIPGSPAIGGDGRVRVHSSDGKLHCVTAEGEAGHAPVDVGEPLGWASPVVDRQGNTWTCLYNGGLLRVDARGVRGPSPFFRTRQKFDCTPLIRGDMLYVGAEDGFVYAIDLAASRGRNQWDPLTGGGKTEWFINSSPALSPQGALIVAGRDEFLYSFDFDGKVLWKLHLRGQMLGSPVVTGDGDVLVGLSLIRRGQTGQGKLVCVDSRGQRVRWEYAADGAVESTPVIGDDGLIYFGDNSGSVHAVQQDGRKAWTAQVGSAVRSAGTISPAGRLVFGTDSGALVALNCASKSISDAGWSKYMGTLGQAGSVQRA